MNRSFPLTRAAGLARLAAFTPYMGRHYAAGRNTDPGPDGEPEVSGLSPYIRRRLVCEEEVVAAALEAHGPSRAEKFIDEVFWRTYWKGWLEQRPGVWFAYNRDLAAEMTRLDDEAGFRSAHARAVTGATGLACFDAWARELVETNWLHNHTRMWFASIWIFTLRLPWVLGAAFFMRHLLDGDAASNTLSWRWVAGLQTRGKAYAARAENIARYTESRFNPAGELNEAPDPLTEDRPLPAPVMPTSDPAPTGEVALLLHDDDLAPETLSWPGARIGAVAALDTPRDAADRVATAQTAALRDGLSRAAAHYNVADGPILRPAALDDWADGRPVVMPWAPVGPIADQLAAEDRLYLRVMRPWDALSWPHCSRGYFQLRTRIPAILRTLGHAA